MLVKGKVDFRHIQIWHWVCLSKEKLTLYMSKYDIEYICQRKSWFCTCPKMTLSMFVKGKVDFIHVQIWLSIYLSKKNLTLDMSKYDFENVCQRKSWFKRFRNMTLSMIVKGKVDFRYVEIWLWVLLLKEKLTLNVSKYDFEYYC
jgi:predicted nucleic acid-binding Zn finger protein